MHTEGASSTQLHPLTPGHLLTLALPEGSTVICLGEALLLSTTPLSTLDACSGYSLRLHNGQSWRAPAALWVQLQCVEQRSRVQVQMSLPAPKENRPALARLGRLVLSCLRQLSSSFKPGRRAA